MATATATPARKAPAKKAPAKKAASTTPVTVKPVTPVTPVTPARAADPAAVKDGKQTAEYTARIKAAEDAKSAPTATVWVAPITLGKYHTQQSCKHVKDVKDQLKATTVAKAVEDKLQSCPACAPDPAKQVAPVKAAPAKPTPPKVEWTANELSANYGELLEALKRATVTTGKRPVLPILAGVMIMRNDAGEVVMRASDLETWTETVIHGAFLEVNKPVVINAHQLLDALVGIRGKFTAAQAHCERIDLIHSQWGRVVLSGFGRTLDVDTEAERAGLNVADYPSWPAAPKRQVARFQSGSFVDGYSWGLTGAGSDETLPMLTSVLLESNGKSLYFVGTDRYRLVVTEVPVVLFSDFKLLIPRHNWRVLKAMTGPVEMFFDKPAKSGPGQVRFVSGDVAVQLVPMDATFPAYRSLLPDTDSTWTVNRFQLIGDVIAAASVTSGRAPVNVEFSAGKYQVKGCPIHKVESSPKAETMTTAFNPEFLLSGLMAFTADEVVIGATSSLKPFVITGDRNHHRATFLQMPVRLAG